MAERYVGVALRGGLPRLGHVLHRAEGLDVRRLFLRSLHGPAGDEELRRHYFGSLDTGRMVANRAFEVLFDPPMYGFRSDPYDNQSGECEADGIGLYGEELDTRKELIDFEDL